MEKFLRNEQCERCKGPISAEPCLTTRFVEETGDYIRQTVWLCYACGEEHTLQSEPHYVF